MSSSNTDSGVQELEAIFHQSRQLADRLGSGSESAEEITRQHLAGLREASRSIYDGIAHPSRDFTAVYQRIVGLYEKVGL